MRIVYRVTEEDYLEAYDLFVAHEKWLRRMSRRTMPWMGGFILILSIAILASGQDPFLSGAFALMGVYFVYCGFALKRLFRQRFRKDRRFQSDITADISEEGVHVVTSFEDTQLKWNALVRFLESDRIFMFFHSELIFSVVPKRAFPEAEIEPFRDLLRRKIVATPASN